MEPPWQHTSYVEVRDEALVPTFNAFVLLAVGDRALTTLAADAFFVELFRDIASIGGGEQRREDVIRRWHRRLQELAHAAVVDSTSGVVEWSSDENGAVLLKPGMRGPYLVRDGVSVALPADLEPDELDARRIDALFSAKARSNR